MQDHDINTLSFLDKVNMRSKSMNTLDIDFSDEETELLKQVDDIKTFDDVMKLAKELLACKNKKMKKCLLTIQMFLPINKKVKTVNLNLIIQMMTSNER